MAEIQDKNYRHILRIANTDLDGSKPIFNALRKIKGVGFMYSNLVLSIAAIAKDKRCGNLSDAEAKQLDEIIRNPFKYDVPVWMMNRRRDYETNEDNHLISSDLDYTKGNDIKRLRKIKCYKGVRHSSGLPTRGQKTKSNFRRNKGKKGGQMGVQKKK